jgi:hypothetical protein
MRERLQSSPTPPPSLRIPMNQPRLNAGGGETPLRSLTEVRRILQTFCTSQAGGGAPQKSQPRSSAPLLSPQAHNIFSNGRDGKAEGSGKEGKDSGMMLTRTYSYADLGKRLGELRPANVAKDGKERFSLEELQGRIAKLAKLEEQEDQLGGSMSEIRKSVMNFKNLFRWHFWETLAGNRRWTTRACLRRRSC